MTEDEEFQRLTNQPEMRDMKQNPVHPALVACCMLISLTIGVGGVAAVIWLSWKIAVITAVLAFSLLILGAALSLRSTR